MIESDVSRYILVQISHQVHGRYISQLMYRLHPHDDGVDMPFLIYNGDEGFIQRTALAESVGFEIYYDLNSPLNNESDEITDLFKQEVEDILDSHDILFSSVTGVHLTAVEGVYLIEYEDKSKDES